MKKFALIGHPIGHSMSPLIHEKLFALSGMKDCDYSLIDIDPADIPASGELIRSHCGMNVTIPHKQSVIALMDELDETAKRYNSVNCIKNLDGKLIGYNTDCTGFLYSAKALPLDGKVLLVGCGGVGRMMAIETALHGGELTIGIIPQDRALAEKAREEILAACPAASVGIEETSALDGDFDLMINATPVGMYPKTEACAVPDSVIGRCGSFFDAVYNPTETLLIRKARALGRTAVGGAAMLVYQAVKAHEIWYGGEFSSDDIAPIITAVEDAVAEMNRQKG